MSHRLNAGQREAHLARASGRTPFDVLVVGGGVVGTGVALDAAARGLSVALVERRDLAWGTSRWSSKLVHGGLRYLAQGAVDVALECARERQVLLRRTRDSLCRGGGLGSGARLRDELTGARFDVRARSVVNAAGVWAGMLSVPVAGERGRWVFAIGQRNGLALVGLTDMAEDIPFLLETISGAVALPLPREDVVGSFAGLRPLVDGASGVPSADLSRRHAVVRGEGGLVSVIGGKLTTYRRIAEQAVDAAVEAGGLEGGPCRTRSLPLVGAAPRQALAAIPAPGRLVDRHGAQAPVVLALAGGDPALLAPVAPGLEVLVEAAPHAAAA